MPQLLPFPTSKPAPGAAQMPSAETSIAQQRLLYALLALGVFFRLFHFFDNRSFFIDELFLNVNIIKLGFRELATLPFEYEQKAPLGYLWSVRLFVELLGRQEQALRLFSLLCGLGALFAFVPVARFFLPRWAVVVAVGALALAYPAVYHAVEAKQYSTELLAAVLALYLYVRFKDQLAVGALVLWGCLGGLLLWFSFSTIFVLAGIGAALCVAALAQRDWPRFFRYLIPGSLWVLSFGLVYYFFVSKYQDSGWLSYFFKIKYDGYLPATEPAAAAKWLLLKAYALLSHPLGLLLEVDNDLNYFGFKQVLKMGWLYLPLIGLGAWRMLRQSWQQLLVLVLPLAFTLLASAVSQYPFYQRFTLFLAPALLLLFAGGAWQLKCWLGGGRQLSYALLLVLLVPSLANSARQVAQPTTFYNREYYREAVLFVDQHFRPDDAVYVYWNMRQAYDYYEQAYPLRHIGTRASYVKNQSGSQTEYLQKLQPDFVAFQGKKRLWFVYDSNNRDAIGDFVDQPAWYHAKAYPPGRVLKDHFARLGRQVLHFRRGTCEVVLYEFN